ncbi:hypothetical protein [Dyella psychrodurans]|uniref:hypothetical protein n=1 Tax=Dyella psychrodurans TaxID=1927960 RepID=UPI0018F4ACF8|nr:hypothetical protein [Dyella psychrodurans]
MLPSKSNRPLLALMVTGSIYAGHATAQMASATQDFSGIWQLNDRASDSAAVITERLHQERRREQAPSSRPAGASSSATASNPAPSGMGHGGGHGMGGGGMGGGGGHGMGGGRHGNQDSQSSSGGGSGKPAKDPTPPLFANDALLNVQQNSAGMRVDFNNTDRLDTKFDGVARQALNGSAHVQTQLTHDGMQVSMDFGDGTRLDQTWMRSPDGHHLTVTETWTTSDLKDPIVFTRSYDRLDL